MTPDALTVDPLTPAPILRRYEPHELHRDGYPLDWHRCTMCAGTRVHGSGACPRCLGAGSAKELVRCMADHRCLRCGHRYVAGTTEPEWSRCDDACTHGGPFRWVSADGEVLLATNAERPNRVHPDDWLALTKHKAPEMMGGMRSLYFERDPRLEAQWRILTVHHLQTGQEAKADLRWWNLASLCQRCHLTIQGKVQLPKPWIYEHTEWFKPHAAGYYAWAILDQDITRRAALERQDELLALEHRQHSLLGRS